MRVRGLLLVLPLFSALLLAGLASANGLRRDLLKDAPATPVLQINVDSVAQLVPLEPTATATEEPRVAAEEPTATLEPDPTATTTATATQPPTPAPPPHPPVSARAFAILERSCGALLYGQSEREAMPPASLTKIVTAIVVSQRVRMNEVVLVDVSGSQMAQRGSSVMGIEPGQSWRAGELIAGLLLPSGNDAALALAAHAGGSVPQFVALMNEEAKRLGMTNTNFANPHGLDSNVTSHYSTALDMALAARALLDDPVLAEVVALKAVTVASGLESGIELRNGNQLVGAYPGAYGVKIGYTRRARHTIVIAAQRGGRHLIVSALGSESLSQRNSDATALLDWAFASLPRAC